TFCLSVLSFFTTYKGLTILLDPPLAVIGSLGLQIALLGLAWNLMKVRQSRAIYMGVFMVAAAFSIFFSYANFDSSLKSYTRTALARSSYVDTARPILTSYAMAAKEALVKGNYQTDRLSKLAELEEKKGWATIVDEGSNDPYVQSVLEGARRTVESWKRNEGTDYRQGGGRGIILNYIESHIALSVQNVRQVEAYSVLLDSLLLAFGTDDAVDNQYALVNQAWVVFPTSQIAALTSVQPDVAPPPNPSNFVELPKSRQQAFQLVIEDLITMDYLAFFSLLLAFAIDFIVIVMAFAGSLRMDDSSTLFDRVRQEASRQIKRMPLDDSKAITRTLRKNLNRFETAGRYNLDVDRFFGEHRQSRKDARITLQRGPELVEDDSVTKVEDERPSEHSLTEL
ncbi:MAG: hypothetical protein KAT79_05660, partial [candidate division Zixibacteria bacterium]|nr:hypothetical protein [candidate division Zixibacteria bacterium]